MGILGLTKTIAKEWGPVGVRCNGVAFGMINTRLVQSADDVKQTHTVAGGKEIPQGMPADAAAMINSPQFLRMAIPMGRVGTPEEAAGGIVLMSSPLAGFVTGHTLEGKMNANGLVTFFLSLFL